MTAYCSRSNVRPAGLRSNLSAMEQAINIPTHLAAPARRALAGAGYTRLEQIADITEHELSQLHGMGPKALSQLRIALAEYGLEFAGERNHE